MKKTMLMLMVCTMAATGLQADRGKIEAAKANARILAAAVEAGLVVSVRPGAHELVVNPVLWAAMDYRQKLGLATVASEFFQAETGLARVAVLSSKTNKRLASYGASTGLRIH